MANQPFYHLRPNKNIDRRLFIQTLIGLNKVHNISDYQYTGFGSYLFDDFKLLHDTLNISNMISLERDPNEFKRAEFNKPYNCIEIKNIGSTEYISGLMIDDGTHSIFWLDFVSPSELGKQIADYASLLDRLNPYDIVRITLNANPSSLGKSITPDLLHETRLTALKEMIPYQYFPETICAEHVTTEQYPLSLLKILKKVTVQLLTDTPPYSSNFMLPLFSSIYADGQQMLTFTGIVLDSHDKEATIRESLKSYEHNTFSWDDPCKIEIPALSVREITELNKLLPNPEIREQLVEKFSFIFPEQKGQAVDSYLSFYKYYPNYHQVSF